MSSLSGVSARRYNFLINDAKPFDQMLLETFNCRYICWSVVSNESFEVIVGFVVIGNNGTTRARLKKKFRSGTFVERAFGCTNANIMNIKRSDGEYHERGVAPRTLSYCCRCDSERINESLQDDEGDVEVDGVTIEEEDVNYE